MRKFIIVFGIILLGCCVPDANGQIARRERSGSALPSNCVDNTQVVDVFVLKSGVPANDGEYWCNAGVWVKDAGGGAGVAVGDSPTWTGLHTFTPTVTVGNGLSVTGTPTSGTLVSIAASGTGATSNTKTGLKLITSGANTGASQTTYGAQVSNTSTGTTSTNIAASFSAVSGTTNYDATFGSAGNGNSGLWVENLAGPGFRRMGADRAGTLTYLEGDGLYLENSSSGTAFVQWRNDTALARAAAGVVEVDNGTLGTLATLKAATVNATTGFQNNGIAQFFSVTSDFTTAANTNLQLITGLSWTIPANTAMNIPFQCHLAYAQGTAAVAVSFGIQDVTVAPTNIFATGHMQTAATVFTEGNLPTLTTTTATAIVSATPSAITTVWNADLYGFIEQPSNASTSAVQIQVKTATAGDAVTVKRGSVCRIN
jgi:hypothetical protein